MTAEIASYAKKNIFQKPRRVFTVPALARIRFFRNIHNSSFRLT